MQTIGFEPMQVPPRQAPLWVQRLPSSQAVRSASVVWVQPLAGSQPSAVQLLPSLQSGGGPPTQLPPAQVSAVVQALPSSQAAVLFVCTQPRTGSQESSVHGLPSSQGGFGTFMQPTWQALIDGAMYCEPQLREIIGRQRPEVIVEDNVVAFPALQTAGKPFVRIV